MSCKISIENLTQEQTDQISGDLEIKVVQSKYDMGPPKYVYPYVIDQNNYIHLPFAYGFKITGKKRPIRQNFPQTSIEFIGQLREGQIEVKKEAISILSKKGNIMVSAYPGFGKTALSINISASIKFKTLIVVHRVVLINQWEDSLKKFCPDTTIQKLTAKSKKKDADYYIINAINVPKLGNDFFSDIGTVIIDEAHLIMAEKLSQCMQNLHPRYLIGLTATPYRPDGLNILLELYFGSYKIIRKLYRKHTVYRINTGFSPRVELTKTGRVNWNVILDDQANNVTRNEIIIDILKKHNNRDFMVLTKRISQAEYLLKRLKEEDEKVTTLIGSQQDFNPDARILIGTVGKIGVGFDHDKLNALLLAGDVEEYFIQYLGRVFRTKEVEPIIFDIVDKNGILERHFSTRRKIYHEHGGLVKKYDL
jgi:superfamily II DNA or RNA helicase